MVCYGKNKITLDVTFKRKYISIIDNLSGNPKIGNKKFWQGVFMFSTRRKCVVLAGLLGILTLSLFNACTADPVQYLPSDLTVRVSSEGASVFPVISNSTVVNFEASVITFTITQVQSGTNVFSTAWSNGMEADLPPVSIAEPGEYLVYVSHQGMVGGTNGIYNESVPITILPGSKINIQITPGGVGIVVVYVDSSSANTNFQYTGTWGTNTVPQNGDSSLRGLCATTNYLIFGRIRNVFDQLGYVEIYNRSTGELLLTVTGNSEFFGHGIASDENTFWTSDYFDSYTIYHYSITNGALLGQWSVTDFIPSRMAYDPETGHLFITGYNTTYVYEYTQDGNLVRSISFIDGGVNPCLKKGDHCWYVYCSPANPESDLIFYTYSEDWHLIGQEYAGWGNWDFGLFDNHIYCDSPEGYIQEWNK